MDKFAESAHRRQLDNPTPCVEKFINELDTHIGRGGAHRPVILHAEFENRVELLYATRILKERRHVGRIRVLVQRGELMRLLDDPQPDGCVYVPGDAMNHSLQRRIVAKYRDEVQRHLAPPVFVVVTHLHPDRLRAQGVWRDDLRKVFADRVVTVPSAPERHPLELVELYKNAVRRAADKKGVTFRIDPGALELLTLKWAAEPPPSLDFVITVANKSLEDALAHRNMVIHEAAVKVADREPVRITGKQIVDAALEPCELSTRASDGDTIH